MKIRCLIFLVIAMLSAGTVLSQDYWVQIGKTPMSKVVGYYDQIESVTILYGVKKDGSGLLMSSSKSNFANWTPIGDAGSEAVTAGYALYILSKDKKGVYKYGGTSNTPNVWDKIGDAAAAIYGGLGGLYATNPESKDILGYNPGSKRWTGVGGPGKMFAVGGQGRLYGLSPDGTSVWKYSGTGTKWDQIGGGAKYIYAGGNELYAISPRTSDIMRYLGNAQKWERAGGPGKMFAVDDTGNVYGISPDGSQIWEYRIAKKQWLKVGDSAAYIFACGNRQLFAIHPQTGMLWRWVLQ